MFGQPYHQNTLKPVAPSEQASMNISVCSKCSRLAQLYHKLYHQKHQMFTICTDAVDFTKKNSPGLDIPGILNELLTDDQWLEMNFRIMQDLWADADTFVRWKGIQEIFFFSFPLLYTYSRILVKFLQICLPASQTIKLFSPVKLSSSLFRLLGLGQWTFASFSLYNLTTASQTD